MHSFLPLGILIFRRRERRNRDDFGGRAKSTNEDEDSVHGDSMVVAGVQEMRWGLPNTSKLGNINPLLSLSLGLQLRSEWLPAGGRVL